MTRTFVPAEGYNKVEFAASGVPELVVVTPDGLAVETHETRVAPAPVLDAETGEPTGEYEDREQEVETNVNLLFALEAHPDVVEQATKKSAPAPKNPPDEPALD